MRCNVKQDLSETRHKSLCYRNLSYDIVLIGPQIGISILTNLKSL